MGGVSSTTNSDPTAKDRRRFPLAPTIAAATGRAMRTVSAVAALASHTLRPRSAHCRTLGVAFEIDGVALARQRIDRATVGHAMAAAKTTPPQRRRMKASQRDVTG